MPKKTLICLALLALVTPSASYGFHRFFDWWRRPAVRPVMDVAFEQISSHHVNCFNFIVADSTLVSVERVRFGDTTLSATVTDGILKFSPFGVTNENGATMSFIFQDAELVENVFGSFFRAKGTALVKLEPDNGVNNLDSVNDVMEVPVRMSGIIIEHDGRYQLQARAMGFSVAETGDNTIQYRFLRLRLGGKVPVPTELQLKVTTLSSEITEPGPTDPNGATIGTVTRSGGTTGDVVVELNSSDTSEAMVPETVTIPDGESSVDFTITAVDDTEPDGTQSVTITATASGFADGIATLNVLDDDEVVTGGGGDIPPGAYDILVVFPDDSLTPGHQAIFADAEDVWERIVTGDVPDVMVTGVGLVDDLRIVAMAIPIDGVGGIVAQAGPTVLRPGSYLPANGIMQFDTADISELQDRGQLKLVILHEMAHVMGFGTIWDRLGLLSGQGTTNPRFNGPVATAQYNTIFGVSESGVPLENRGGAGTVDSHWRASVFDNELMTGFLSAGGAAPISRVTVGHFADLGYTVDLDAADSFTPPLINNRRRAPVRNGNLRFRVLRP